MHTVLALLIGASALAPSLESCPLMQQPVDAPVSQGFAPVGRYGGHWGVDYGTPTGTEVIAADSGTVSFSGVVAGNRTVTVDHGGGVKTSYSYLAAAIVEVGEHVRRGQLLALSGTAHGEQALHFSIRVAATYVDPVRMFMCSTFDVSAALRLVPASRSGRSTAYPGGREKGHPRRNVRSTAHRSSPGGRSRLPAARARRGDVHPCR